MLQYQSFMIPVLITIILINNAVSNHKSKNNPDVIITYEGHAEANLERKPVSRLNTESNSSNTPIDEYLDPEKDIIPITQTYEEDKEDVFFIPNERETRRIVDELNRDSVNIGDVMTKQSVGRLMNEKPEKPNEDILFISGKNNENTESDNKKERSPAKYSEIRRSGPKMVDYKPKVVINCKNLDCNNTINSVCGGKIEHKKWRYRLFLNECFFRKVNCGFSYTENRYREVSIDKCKNIGAHLTYRPYAYDPLRAAPSEQVAPVSNLRKAYSSRRALTKGIDGNLCSHSCPLFCPDDYDPECAMSSSGQRKVFVNHCKLDYNSCFHGVAWRRRPLSECVGGKKADLRQNRAFIAWMQKVGIVNEKGRLMLHR